MCWEIWRRNLSPHTQQAFVGSGRYSCDEVIQQRRELARVTKEGDLQGGSVLRENVGVRFRMMPRCIFPSIDVPVFMGLTQQALLAVQQQGNKFLTQVYAETG